MHDIGKVGIPDHILLKPGRLTPEEFEIMKTHTTLGRDAIEHAERHSIRPVEFLRIAKEIASTTRKNGTAAAIRKDWRVKHIPLSARLMAVADVYDALISRRVYKEGMPHEKAVEIIREGRAPFRPGHHRRLPGVIQETFRAIAARFADDEHIWQRTLKRVETALSDETIVLGGSHSAPV